MDLNQKYFELLLRKKDNKTEDLILKNDDNDSKLIPFSLVSDEDEAQFNLYNYRDLSIDEALLRSVDLKILKMQAGLGTSVKRDDLIDGKLSAKGVDLTLDYKGSDSPIAKIHYYIKEEIKNKKNYKNVTLQNLVNDETKSDIENLFEDDDVLTSIEQLKMPTIDESGELSDKRLAPCGHGFIGIHEIVDAINGSSDELVCIGNGEDLNSTIDEKIASLVVKENISILMVTTDKTQDDKKGGQLALVKEKIPYLTIVEKAQAQSSGQLEYFEKLGLRENDKKGLFNTNIVVINKKALRKNIKECVKDFNLDSFLESISPNVIKNKKSQNGESFIQLESALGSVVLNTDRYFRENHNQKILSVLNLSQKYRDRFFLPIKKREDYDFIKANYSFDYKELKLLLS